MVEQYKINKGAGHALLLLMILNFSTGVYTSDKTKAQGRLVGGGPKSVHTPTSRKISRLAFASCYHQDKNSSIFKAIKRYAPDVFLWTGDAVYHTSGHNATTLERTFKDQFDRPEYKAFRENTDPKPYIDGTWDDHDYGVNDAGKALQEKSYRQHLFLNFLEIPPDSKRRSRTGTYSTFTFGPNGNKVRFILLDTRTFRDSHVIPSVGGIPWLHPIGAVIACMTRFFLPFLA